MWNPPVKGLTMRQSWDTLGMAWGGDVLKDSEKVPLDGIINAYGRAGLGVSLSAPRAVVTFPTMRQPAVTRGEPNDLIVTIGALATGDLSQAADAFWVQVDTNTAFNLRDYVELPGNDRLFNAGATGAGLHTVKVWLTQKANPTVPIAGSESTGTFCVGPGCMTTVPVVKGLTAAYARNAITSAFLKAGTTTLVASSTVPLGYVVETVPPADAVLAQGTTVDLHVSSTEPTPPPCDPPNVVINGACVPPPPPPTSPSPDPTRGTLIVDTQLHVWTLPNGQTTRDGLWVNGGLGNLYAWCGGQLFVLGADSNWYAWISNAWSGRGAADPCVNVPPPPTPVTLTVVSGSGSGSFIPGTVVAITANAAPAGQAFASWTGASVLNAAATSTTLVMPATATTVTATYAVIPPVCTPPETLQNGVCVPPPSPLLPPGTYTLCNAAGKCVTMIVQ